LVVSGIKNLWLVVKHVWPYNKLVNELWYGCSR
jgi:hypothetical protein